MDTVEVRDELNFTHGKRWTLKYILVLVAVRAVVAMVIALLGRAAFGLSNLWQQNPMHTFLGMFSNWDGPWYMQIAQHGYLGPKKYAFFPLFPILIKIGSPLLGLAGSGITISVVALTFATFGVYRVAGLFSSESISIWASFAFVFSPGSYSLIAVYPMSLLAALAIWCCYFTIKKNWYAASLCALFAGATQAIGPVLAVAVGLSYLVTQSWKRYEFPRAVWYTFIGFLGYGAYTTYGWIRTGHLTFQARAESYWSSEISNPISLLIQNIHQFINPRIVFDITDSRGAKIAFAFQSLSIIFFILLIICSLILVVRSREFLPVVIFTLATAGAPMIFRSGLGDVGRFLWGSSCSFVVLAVLLERVDINWRPIVESILTSCFVVGMVFASLAFNIGMLMR